MRQMRRSEMKPGTVFGVGSPLVKSGHVDAFVVIDHHREVGFWTGTEWALGDVCPSLHFPVLSP